MFNRKSLATVPAAVAIVVGATAISLAQIPAAAPAKPPMRVEMKPSAQAAGPLGKLGVVLEIQADQPNVPNGLRGTIVVTNPGTEPVEFLDPRDSSQLELQTADGRTLRVPPAIPSSLVNIPGAKPAVPVRLAPKESHRVELVVSEVLGEGKTAAPSAPPQAASPNPTRPASNAVPLDAGKYRVRARAGIMSAQGKPGEKRPLASFESGWTDVSFGTR